MFFYIYLSFIFTPIRTEHIATPSIYRAFYENNGQTLQFRSEPEQQKDRETEDEEEPSVSCFHFSNNGHQKEKKTETAKL